MTINGEEVELVTSFDELRPGMIAWEVDCDWCGGKHRSLLISLDSDPWEDVDGSTHCEPSWNYVPDAPCGSNCFASDDVFVGKLYAVVDPKLAATTARKREPVRT